MRNPGELVKENGSREQGKNRASQSEFDAARSHRTGRSRLREGDGVITVTVHPCPILRPFNVSLASAGLF